MSVLRLPWVFAAGLLLAGCASDVGQPGTLPAVSPPSSRGAPSPTAPDVPAVAREMTAQGASSFAAYFVRSIGIAYNQARPELLTSLSAAGCGGCDRLIATVTRLRDQGSKRIGGNYTVTSSVTPALVGGDALVDVQYVRTAGRVVNAAGVTVESAGPVGRTDAQVRVVWRGNAWVVQGYRVVSP